MSPAGLIFFGVFVLPLVAFLIWVMRQDKRKGLIGLVVLAIFVIVAVIVLVKMNAPLPQVQY